jgi:hypothetical protein
MHTPTRHNLGCAPCVGLPSRPTRPRRWAATLPTKSTTHTIQLDRAVGTPPPASPPLPAPPTHRCYTCSTCTCSSAKHTRVERRRTLGTAPATRAARSHSVLHNAACSRRARTTGCHPDACPGHPTAVVLQQRCTRGPRQATLRSRSWLAHEACSQTVVARPCAVAAAWWRIETTAAGLQHLIWRADLAKNLGGLKVMRLHA